MAGKACHVCLHYAFRLNSGVSPQKKWFSAKSFFFAKAKELLCPTLARAPAYLGPDTPPPGGTSLGFKPKPIIQAFGGNSRLQWANNSFKPTPLRGVVVTSSHPSVPALATLPQRRGLIQALCAAGEESLAGPRPSATTGRRAGPRGRDSLRSAVASVTLSPKLARARAGNAAAMCLRPSRRIPASQARSP